MNMTNIPMTSWNSSGISSGTGGSIPQSSIGGTSPDGSVFQQLIAQLTAMNNQNGGLTQGNLAETESSGAAVENGTLMELLFSGENSGGLESLQTEGQAGRKDENGELEILLALMSGLPAAAAMPANSENTDSSVGTQTSGLSLQNGNDLLSETIPSNQGSVLGSLAFAKGQGVVFRSGALYAQSVEAGEMGNGLNQAGQSSESVSISAGEMIAAVPRSGENKNSRTGIPILSEAGLPVETSTGLIYLQEGGETEGFDLSAVKRELQQTGGLRAGLTAADETVAATQIAGGSIIAQADDQKSDGADQTSAGQEYLNTVHYTDPVKESGTLSQSVQTSGKAEQYSQISDEILSRLEQKNSNEFRMQLQPEDLGQIDIKLKLNEGRLTIDIMAANSKTQTLLTNQVDKLIASMGLQNVQVESVQVSQQMNQQSNSGQNQWQSMNFGMDFSQQRNQEQLHKQMQPEDIMTGSARTSQIEVQETIPVMIQNLRQSNLHRLNYTV